MRNTASFVLVDIIVVLLLLVQHSFSTPTIGAAGCAAGSHNWSCNYHGDCTRNGPIYQCVCDAGWTGLHCETPSTPTTTTTTTSTTTTPPVITTEIWPQHATWFADVAAQFTLYSNDNVIFFMSAHQDGSVVYTAMAVRSSTNNFGNVWGDPQVFYDIPSIPVNAPGIAYVSGTIYIALVYTNPQNGVILCSFARNINTRVSASSACLQTSLFSSTQVQNAPSMTVYKGVIYLAVRRTDGAIGLSSSVDGRTWSDLYFPSGFVTSDAPKLSALTGDSSMYLTFVGPSADPTVPYNIPYFAVSTNGYYFSDKRTFFNNDVCCSVNFISPIAMAGGNFGVLIIASDNTLRFYKSNLINYMMWDNWSNYTSLWGVNTVDSAPGLVNFNNHFSLAYHATVDYFTSTEGNYFSYSTTSNT